MILSRGKRERRGSESEQSAQCSSPEAAWPRLRGATQPPPPTTRVAIGRTSWRGDEGEDGAGECIGASAAADGSEQRRRVSSPHSRLLHASPTSPRTPTQVESSRTVSRAFDCVGANCERGVDRAQMDGRGGGSQPIGPLSGPVLLVSLFPPFAIRMPRMCSRVEPDVCCDEASGGGREEW